MKTFSAEIIEDSINPDGSRLTSFVIIYPRFILAEVNTHKMMSKNSASSRAIPIHKMMSEVLENPAMPIRWGKNGKGMQDHGDLSEQEIHYCKEAWLDAAFSAVDSAKKLEENGLQKGWVNRIYENFTWTTTLISGTEWENFFSLRANKQAQPEFAHIAYLMLKEYLSHKPKKSQWGDWHIPFFNNMPANIPFQDKIKIAVARAARVSYNNFDGSSDIEKDIGLYDRLAESGHFSCFEHCSYANQDKSSWANFKGWTQHRRSFINENRKCDLNQLLKDYEKSIK